ncbi:MAG: accessory gene regulator B family protein [Lachnospiraceae bacterium]|nr:accessory gene regulator B family protein [Lachnospiraceae bacterium]
MFGYLQRELHYSDYEIELIKYFFKMMCCELSKFIFMGVFFIYIDLFLEYVVATIVLMSIRTMIGGLHCKTYAGCFCFTFAFFIASVVYLPMIPVSKLLVLICLLVCIIISNYIGPITSVYRKTPTGIVIRNSKIHVSTIVFAYCILVYIMPLNQYIEVGFWVIIAQTIQLMVAYILKKRRCTNEAQD